MVGVILLGMALMTGVYCVMIALIARLNPFVFLRKYAPAMVFWIKVSVENTEGILKPGMPADVTLD